MSLDQSNLEWLSFLSKERQKKQANRGVGRIRIRLAKILSECLDIDCQPDDLKPATGANRSNKTLDIYAWEVFARHHNGVPFVAGCWDTMTDCVKAGKVCCVDGVIYIGEDTR